YRSNQLGCEGPNRTANYESTLSIRHFSMDPVERGHNVSSVRRWTDFWKSNGERPAVPDKLACAADTPRPCGSYPDGDLHFGQSKRSKLNMERLSISIGLE